MDSRRNFLKASAAALTVAATRPLFGAGIQGANDRVRMAIIGTGNRGGRVFDSFCRQKDCQFLAAAEVNKARLDQWMTPARQTFKLDVVGDYRRILERKDIDAVLIATPDHWHSQQMVDAVSAGTVDLPEAVDLSAPTASLLASAPALQLLTLELVHLAGVNPDLIRREQAPYREAARIAEASFPPHG